MNGKVKWFSQAKGYGYIYGNDGLEHYFSVRDVLGPDVPRNGAIVEFESTSTPRGLRARSVVIAIQGADRPARSARSDRVTCQQCGRPIVPRVITGRPTFAFDGWWRPVPIRSICPFCSATFSKFDHQCFIATAVYADGYAPEVISLRRFRDETLRVHFVGRIAIRIYYKISPWIARIITNRPALRAAVRPALDAIAKRYE